MNCCTSCCFDDVICGCPENGIITINTYLNPANTYYFKLVEKFGNVYSGTVIPEPDGTLKIQITDFPAGLFTPWSGEYQLFIYNDQQGCDQVRLLMARKYDCITFTIKKGADNEIGCPIIPTPTGHEFQEGEFSDEFN